MRSFTELQKNTYFIYFFNLRLADLLKVRSSSTEMLGVNIHNWVDRYIAYTKSQRSTPQAIFEDLELPFELTCARILDFGTVTIYPFNKVSVYAVVTSKVIGLDGNKSATHQTNIYSECVRVMYLLWTTAVQLPMHPSSEDPYSKMLAPGI